jgi:hypothetical protein
LTAIKFLIPFLFALVGLLAFVFLFRSADPSPGVAPAIAGAPANADPVARGECLAKAAGCVACHTVPGSGRPFAGERAFRRKLLMASRVPVLIIPDGCALARNHARWTEIIFGGVTRTLLTQMPGSGPGVAMEPAPRSSSAAASPGKEPT